MAFLPAPTGIAALQALVEAAHDGVLERVHGGHVDAAEGAEHADGVAVRTVSATSAECSSALVGMQPRCRMVPPSVAP